MDVAEIFRGAAAAGEPPAKRRALDSEEEATSSNDPNAILAALEADGDSAPAELDEPSVRKLVAQLEKRALRNREQRTKYADEPSKFLESEAELNASIQELTALAASPDLYAVAIDAGLPASLLQLFGHQNSDITVAVLNLLRELTDMETVGGDEGEAGVQLADALGEGRVIDALVVHALQRLDEQQEDEAEGVQYALALVDNLLELRPATVEECCGNYEGETATKKTSDFLVWILRRATQRSTFDANKLYASELLSRLLQQSETAKQQIAEQPDAIDRLLRALAMYKRHDAQLADEREHMENLFDALCAAIMLPLGRERFLAGEGLHLVNLMLREKRQSRDAALKVLNYATNGEEGREACNKFVEILGLRTLFPLFLRTPSKQKRKDTSSLDHEEHVTSVLAALLRFCDPEARGRILAKFTEMECEKTDRAVELFLKYRERVQKWERRHPFRADENQEDESTARLRHDLERLDAGAFTWQRVALVVADVAAHEPIARQRAARLVQMRTGTGLQNVLIPVLRDYQRALDESAADERRRVDELADSVERELAQDRQNGGDER